MTLCSRRKRACLRSPTKPMHLHRHCKISSQFCPALWLIVAFARKTAGRIRIRSLASLTAIQLGRPITPVASWEPRSSG
jgi:hypothetical protein